MKSIPLFQNAKEVNAAKKRYQDWADNGFFDGDRNIIPLLEKLKRYSRIAPIYSCGGHHDIVVVDGKSELSSSEAYIIFVVTKDSYRTLCNLYNRFVNKVFFFQKDIEEFNTNHNQRPGIELRLIQLNKGDNDEGEWYTAVELNFGYCKQATITYFIKIFIDLLERM